MPRAAWSSTRSSSSPTRTVQPRARAHARSTASAACPWSTRGAPVGILTNRDVRFEKNLEQTRARRDDQGAHHRPAKASRVERAKELLHQQPHREAAGRRRRRQAQGPHHHQGHREGAEQHPHAAKDEHGRLRVGAAVGVGEDRDARVHALLAAGCDVIVVDTAHGHSRGRPRRGARDQEELPAGADRRRQRRHRRRLPPRWSRRAPTRVKVGIGPGQHLHHARRRRASACRRSPPSTSARARPRSTASPSSPTAASSTRATSPRRIAAGAAHRHDRLALRRHRRGARRGHPLPGPQLQAVPRHGLARRHAGGLEGPLLPVARVDGEPSRCASSCPRASRAACRTRARWRSRLPAHRRPARGDGLHRAARPSSELRTSPASSSITSAGLRESHVHDVIITKEAPNYRIES